MTRCLLVLVLGLTFTLHPSPFTGVAWADVPRRIHYQGKLANADGSPLIGEHVLMLRLYGQASGGGLLWEEQHVVRLSEGDNGVFALVLGSQAPFGSSISFNDPLWLVIAVDGSEEFSPRQALAAASYAINADLLDGLDSTQLQAVVASQAGAGLTASATTFDVGAGAGIVVGADAVSVDVGTTAGDIVQLDANGALPAVSGANLTSLNASNLTTGTVPEARLPSSVSSLGATIESAEVTDGALVSADTAGTFLAAGSGILITKGDASWTVAATLGTSIEEGELGAGSVGASALAAGAIQPGDIEIGDLPLHASTHQSGGADPLPADSVGASALAASAIQPGDIEAADLPTHASAHQPGGSDPLPTADPVSVGTANVAGSSTSLARADHVHAGLRSIAASGQPQILGDAVLAANAPVTLSQSGGTITIAAPPGNRATSEASSALTIGTASTDLLSVTMTKSQASSVLLIEASVQVINTKTGGLGDRTTTITLFRGSTQLDGSYAVQLGRSGDPGSQVPISLHVVDATVATGSLTFTLKASASGDGVQATTRRLTVIELF